MQLVCMLEGEVGQAATSCDVYFKGTPLRTTDAALIAQLEGLVPSLVALRNGELEAQLLEALE